VEFGKRLHELRMAKWLTLEVLSKKLGTSKGYLSGVENGKVNPPVDKLVRKIARLFGQPELDMLKLACYDKLSKELQDVCRDVLLPKPPAQ
jgi:transcriptional regulator with XRE-family HTH domain